LDTHLFETKKVRFLDFLSFPDMQLASDEVTFITGRSGSGKSTLLRLFNGTLTQSQGEILYRGRDLLQLDPILIRREISLVSQSVFLFDLSIRENFAAFYGFRDLTPPRDDAIKEMLSLCCAPFPLDKDCATMSGGERQRVYLAVFLSFLPRVLMLDEPTSALDAKISAELMQNLLPFCKEKEISVIIISHDGQLARNFANTIIRIGGEEA